ncbi:bifunctional UDP-N-acetylglucosamine diphosphorylase/glucosamine-1-phosphate N-acetyltransferase GlmU [Paenibacillus mesophilus]|uniref:bifunctional UDP-N-acetylglucosamine diphosphorylase/glucosamine-1-phosphate N-acetyltransferase GlmU n=1 Tax=Paenibacillus mesophilus TaxID=2582849 RepID=UPI00110F44D7|nr:bifunctional UDP-N-acetylglucosamine diphosphorylase/glucosamine-1-phosphate N-acetyltransferase GlmU [Paenibacillus mesophilus]TMV44272.1 bifunctional UDP-N-acetylglucosamine diphosphorylase/glucosamine-1-phosphate N-acetyltransferase GlmU [Paenibacillus mesophilus]
MRMLGIVLAAGQGKRMKSKLYKVLHPVCGKPMVGHVLDVLDSVRVDRKVVIVGHGAEEVKSYVGDRAEFALQAEQLGTGHAVLMAKPLLEQEEGVTVVICGDTPLIRSDSLETMIRLHREQGAAATLMSAELGVPQGYGRIVRNEQGHVVRIVEQKDCSPDQDAIREINAGTYCFDNRKLFAALAKVKNDNAQKEYYFTDVVGILREQGETVLAYCTNDESEWIGVNDRVALSEAEKYMRERINRKHMTNGVTIVDPANTYIEKDVEIGADTVLHPGTILRGKTVVGEDCVIGPNCELTDTAVAAGVQIKHSVLSEADVGQGCTVGPFAYLRPGAKLAGNVKIGDFVEIKNAFLDEGAKVSHLSYIGDAHVGKNVNVGCGAITVNYDGFNKHKTVIGDDAFIGSNVNLVAPVTIGKGAFVVAGSTITIDVAENDMAIARERQDNKPGYAEKLRARFKAAKENKSK